MVSFTPFVGPHWPESQLIGGGARRLHTTMRKERKGARAEAAPSLTLPEESVGQMRHAAIHTQRAVAQLQTASQANNSGWVAGCPSQQVLPSPQTVRPTSVAVCITGLLRTLLSKPVTASFDAMVRSPLRVSGHTVDSFIVLTEQDPENVTLRARVTAAYSPVVLKLVADRPPRPRCRLAQFLGHTWYGGGTGILQHFAASACFNLVSEAERRRQADYGWVLRLRTDIVFFSPLWLPSREDRVFVPAGGMSAQPFLKCCNDHLFLCPRPLCSEYATFIYNFDNSKCKPLPGYSAGGDGVLPDGSIRPAPNNIAFSWHLTRAYNASKRDPCGKIAELGLVYALAYDRVDGEAGALACDLNLQVMWRVRARALVRPAVAKCAFDECLRLSQQSNGGRLLNRTEVASLKRQNLATETRQGAFRAVG